MPNSMAEIAVSGVGVDQGGRLSAASRRLQELGTLRNQAIHDLQELKNKMAAVEAAEPDLLLFEKASVGKLPVLVTLLNGTEFRGLVRWYGRNSVLLETRNGPVLIFKAACAFARVDARNADFCAMDTGSHTDDAVAKAV